MLNCVPDSGAKLSFLHRGVVVIKHCGNGEYSGYFCVCSVICFTEKDMHYFVLRFYYPECWGVDVIIIWWFLCMGGSLYFVGRML